MQGGTATRRPGLHPQTVRRRGRSARLRWLVTFAGRELAALRLGDWLTLRKELTGVLAGLPDHGGLRALCVGVTPATAPAEAFARLQIDLRTLLEDPPLPPPVPVTVALTWRWRPPLVQATGSLRDVALWLTLTLLQDAVAAGLGRCAVCGTVFSRNRNQAYCTRACTNRASQRRWRARQGMDP